MTLPIVLAIAGCIALLVGLFGGGVKAKEIEIPKISPVSRMFSISIGLIMIGYKHKPGSGNASGQ